MRTVLNILNFVLGGFFTTLAWLFATLVSIVLIFTLPLTRSCWEITRLSLMPFGNEAVHVDELYPEKRSALMSGGGTLLNIFWFIFSAGGYACHTFWLASLNVSALSVFRWASRTLKSPPSHSGR